MVGRVCLVTGAAGGMGAAIATTLAQAGATVVLAARTRTGGEAVARAITAATGNPRIEVLAGDLSDQSAVRRLAEDFVAGHDHLHVLVNNAGAHFRERSVSVDGIEMHLAVNHLSSFLLTNLLLGALQAGAPSRVVNVGSASMADTRQVKITRTPRPVVLDLDDLQSEHRFAPMEVYARSKLQLLMCGYALARRLAGSGGDREHGAPRPHRHPCRRRDRRPRPRTPAPTGETSPAHPRGGSPGRRAPGHRPLAGEDHRQVLPPTGPGPVAGVHLRHRPAGPALRRQRPTRRTPDAGRRRRGLRKASTRTTTPAP